MVLNNPSLTLSITPALVGVAAVFDAFLAICAIATVRWLRRTPLSPPRG
jgi:hypothetical protein